MVDHQHEPLPANVSSDTKIAILEERLRSLRMEIDKQAREYERRLSELNHAHERAVEDKSNYVSLDSFVGWQGEINAWRGEVSTKLTLLEGRSSGTSSAQELIFKILPLLVAIAAIGLAYMKGH